MQVPLLSCPFCGKVPLVYPADPDTEGDAWTQIRCPTVQCPAYRGVRVYAERGHYTLAATIWNRRIGL